MRLRPEVSLRSANRPNSFHLSAELAFGDLCPSLCPTLVFKSPTLSSVDPTLADGILDWLVHNAHCIEMRGDSMLKNRAKPNA